jgi:hypothetical protein
LSADAAIVPTAPGAALLRAIAQTEKQLMATTSEPDRERLKVQLASRVVGDPHRQLLLLMRPAAGRN